MMNNQNLIHFAESLSNELFKIRRELEHRYYSRESFLFNLSLYKEGFVKNPKYSYEDKNKFIIPANEFYNPEVVNIEEEIALNILQSEEAIKKDTERIDELEKMLKEVQDSINVILGDLKELDIVRADIKKITDRRKEDLSWKERYEKFYSNLPV